MLVSQCVTTGISRHMLPSLVISALLLSPSPSPRCKSKVSGAFPAQEQSLLVPDPAKPVRVRTSAHVFTAGPSRSWHHVHRKMQL